MPWSSVIMLKLWACFDIPMQSQQLSPMAKVGLMQPAQTRNSSFSPFKCSCRVCCLFMNRTSRSPLFQVFYSILAIPLLRLTGSSLLPDGTDERCVGFVDIGSSQGTVSVVKFFRKDWQRSCRDGRHGRVHVSEVGFTLVGDCPLPLFRKCLCLFVLVH